ncbi:MAG: hypothetical protein KKC68_04795, partial [Candidatus Thermoplasmatota archaeon]|nr:hypothetical protein [Candidatus Thermoplasmatota archaeon]MBU1941070.1 hypothetical protein [Candidatus Thermoplasmatota archaeon]
IYLAARTRNPSPTETALYFCNKTSGATTKIGTFQGNARITALAIPNYSEPPVPDTVPPISTHTIDPQTPNGANGWYKSQVNITISVTDDRSGPARTFYSLNNGNTWNNYSGTSWPFTISLEDGQYQLLYYSIDRAGNPEEINGPYTIMIDTIPPEFMYESFPINILGIYIITLNFGMTKDQGSGLWQASYYLNQQLHHQNDLTWWPGQYICPIIWPYFGQPHDICTCIISDQAGNTNDGQR